MKNAILRRLLLGRRLARVEQKKRLYDEPRTPSEIVDHQIERFNAVWEKCWQTIPFYRHWRETHRLPKAIQQPGDLDGFPVLTKAVLQAHEDLVFQGGKIRDSISTGGSTGVPTRFPVDLGHRDDEYASLYAARAWWGVEPLDDTVLF
ncbi:MAG: hypothetical protein V3U03_14130 [Myxococcota bacterium]